MDLPVLNVRTLQVVDDEGRARIQLNCTPKGEAQVSVIGTDNQPRIALVVNANNNASIMVRDGRSNRIALHVGPREDEPGDVVGILFRDGAGKPRLRLRFSDTGNPEVLIQDAIGKQRLALGTLPGGTPHIQLLDDGERVKIQLSVGADGNPRTSGLQG